MCPVEKRVWGESNECGRNLDETLMAFKGIVIEVHQARPSFFTLSSLDLFISDDKTGKCHTCFETLKLSPVYV